MIDFRLQLICFCVSPKALNRACSIGERQNNHGLLSLSGSGAGVQETWIGANGISDLYFDRAFTQTDRRARAVFEPRRLRITFKSRHIIRGKVVIGLDAAEGSGCQ